MKEFVFSYPTKVYFGEKVLKKALEEELSRQGHTVMLAYGGGSVKQNGIYDSVEKWLRDMGKRVVDFSAAYLHKVKPSHLGLHAQNAV